MSDPTTADPNAGGAGTPAPASPPPDPAAQAAANNAAASAAAPPPDPKAGTPAPAPNDGNKAVEYKLELPKGASLEASAIERTLAFAKATGLSPESAQHALNHADAEVKADRVKQQEANAETFRKLAFESWPAEIKADKELGGDNYFKTVENCERAAKRFFTEAERETLKKTGWGNHPLMVRFSNRIGAAMADDKFVGGGGGGVENARAADLLYGGTKA